MKSNNLLDLLPGLREIAPRERSSARHLTCRGMGATYSSESNDAVNAGHSTSHNEVEQGVETKDNTTSNGSIGRQETNSQPDQSQEQNVLDTNLEITEDDERRIKRMSEVDTLRWRLKVLEEENKKLHDELSQKEITIIELRQDADRRPTRQIGGYTQVQRKCERLYIEMDALKGKLKQCELFITSLKAGKLNNEKTIIGLRDENCELRSRLSIISSDRPIHAYTDIPSLSDKTRPSRLTEKMSELYDNQWIDAFNEIKTMGVEDENAIGILLKILMETNEVCKDMVSSHYQKLKEACTCFEYSSSADAEYIEKGTIVMTGNINYEMQQGINSIWRESSTKLLHKVIPIIGRKVAEQFDIPLVQMTQTSLYMKECAELCWMMNIQDKPMHLDVIVPEKDGHKYFKSEKFRSYTKTGRHVAFVVWPALYLFEGGSLLKKGVAQGLNFRKSKSGQYHSNVPRS
ncbi:hypothetical protein ACJMK2_031547 [Sinanodonta woodiana]|uniref:Mitochondria-eating protein C-terminal domain-containing protein n=1 Tax=Sinanodonta woodiana TaxID=1069815 RepID=A0ABD3X0J7_SINWO